MFIQIIQIFLLICLLWSYHISGHIGVEFIRRTIFVGIDGIIWAPQVRRLIHAIFLCCFSIASDVGVVAAARKVVCPHVCHRACPWNIALTPAEVVARGGCSTVSSSPTTSISFTKAPAVGVDVGIANVLIAELS